MKTNMSLCKRLTFALLAMLLSVAFNVQAQTPRFKVVAFYNGTWDAAHINFVQEANRWFPQMAAQYNFSYTATNNWNNLNASYLSQYQVVLFLDDAPTGAAQRAAFQTYMQNGGGWMGFHVCAYTDNANAWSWYNNTFLGSGNFRGNTWGPSTAILNCEDRTHPSTQRLPATFTSAVSEWYSWANDLRQNPNIKILASVNPQSFPLGNQAGNIWTSGYYPIIWTNKNYKMVYANFGHNAMNYATNQGLSSTFGSEIQNRFIIDALLWLGGAPTGPAPAIAIPGTVQAENFTNMNNIQTEVTTDAGGGMNVGYIDAGSWMDYKVKVATAGAYNVQFRVASQDGGGSFQLQSGASNLTPSVSVPATGAWQTWNTVNSTVTLPAGEQTIRFLALSAGFNLNWMQFTATDTTTNPPTEDPDTSVAPIGQTIWLRGFNNQYVSSKNGVGAMWCNATIVGGWNQFLVQDAGNGKITLSNQGMYVSSENGVQAMTCNRPAPQGWEQFEWIKNADGTISLKGNNGMFVSSENGTQAMTCNREVAQGWEAFNWGVAGTAAAGARMAVKQEAATEDIPSVVYPNPFSTQVNYTLPGKYPNHTVTIYDINGRAQLRKDVRSPQSTYTLDVSRLPKGLYILDISSGVYHKRVKIQKVD